MNNAISWNIKTQFIPHSKYIISPLKFVPLRYSALPVDAI
jgi:hypothetical protein